MSEKSRDVLIRACKTAWQGALSYFIMVIPTLDINLVKVFTDFDTAMQFLKTTGFSLVCGMLAAALSALYNALLKPWLEKKKNELGDKPLNHEKLYEVELFANQLTSELFNDGTVANEGFEEDGDNG